MIYSRIIFNSPNQRCRNNGTRRRVSTADATWDDNTKPCNHLHLRNVLRDEQDLSLWIRDRWKATAVTLANPVKQHRARCERTPMYSSIFEGWFPTSTSILLSEHSRDEMIWFNFLPGSITGKPQLSGMRLTYYLPYCVYVARDDRFGRCSVPHLSE